MSNTYYRQLNINSKITANIKKKIEESSEDQWGTTLEQNLLLLTIDDFELDNEIVQLITDIGDTNRLAVYRFFGEECYNWHVDMIRPTALNMLIAGFDSMCIFGVPAVNRRFTHVSRLQHEPNQYYLMDVKQMHTVYNFSNETRYILSLGLPNIKYKDACIYLQEHNLLLHK